MNRFIYRSAIWASNDYENRTIKIKRSIVRALFWRWRFCFVLCSHPFPSQCVLSPLPKSPNSLCLLDIIIVILVSLLLTSSLSYIRKILNIITVTMTFAIIEHWFHANVFSDILKNLTRLGTWTVAHLVGLVVSSGPDSILPVALCCMSSINTLPPFPVWTS